MQFQYRLYPRCQNVVRLCDFPAVFPFLFSTHFAPAHKVCFLKYEDNICADTRFLSSLTIFCRKINNNSSCLMFVCLCVFASIQHLFQIDTLIVEKKMRRRRAGDVRLSAFIGSLRLGLSGFHQKVPLVCLGRACAALLGIGRGRRLRERRPLSPNVFSCSHADLCPQSPTLWSILEQESERQGTLVARGSLMKSLLSFSNFRRNRYPIALQICVAASCASSCGATCKRPQLLLLFPVHPQCE